MNEEDQAEVLFEVEMVYTRKLLAKIPLELNKGSLIFMIGILLCYAVVLRFIWQGIMTTLFLTVLVLLPPLSISALLVFTLLAPPLLWNRKAINQKIFVQFLNEGFRGIGTNGIHEVRYASLMKVVETKTFFFMSVSDRMMYIIVKENCSPELQAFLSQKVTKKKKLK